MGTRELNLCELLKGHEGEKFYSPVYGYVTLKEVNKLSFFPITITNENSNVDYILTDDGKFNNTEEEECILFPSKEQRDWNKWIEEQTTEMSKTRNDKEIGVNYHCGFEEVADPNETINWEQRRYEIAKSVVQGIWSNPNLDATFGQCTKWAIEQADNLINKLKDNSHD